jgi:hypothetical protein
MPKKQRKTLLLFLGSKTQAEPTGFFSTKQPFVPKLSAITFNVFLRLMLAKAAASQTTAIIIASNAPFLE